LLTCSFGVGISRSRYEILLREVNGSARRDLGS
jgi:hypothetical protein